MTIFDKLYFKFFGDIELITLLLKLAISIAIIVGFKIISVIFTKKNKFLIQKIFKFKSDYLENALSESIQKPAKTFLLITGVYLAIIYFPFSPSISINLYPFVAKLYRISIIAIITYSIHNFIGNIPVFSKGFQESKNKTIILFFIRISKILVIFLAVVIIFKEFNYDISGIVAGLGLGGLTVALAAQDTASNFFSGMVILFDKPFSIGDWISVGSMEGIVEEMNFRSCRIRTFDNALISVPNSKLSSDNVANWTKMDKRKAKITFGLVYSTKKDTLHAVCDEIKEKLKQYPEIVQDTIIVWFDKFNSSSLDVVVQYHALGTSFSSHQLLKEKVLYMIMEVVENHDTDFAFDTKTIIYQNPDEI